MGIARGESKCEGDLFGVFSMRATKCSDWLDNTSEKNLPNRLAGHVCAVEIEVFRYLELSREQLTISKHPVPVSKPSQLVINDGAILANGRT